LFQYLTVSIWAFGVLLIERQKNKILRSLEQSSILAKYKAKIEEVHNQSKGLSEEISLLDRHFKKEKNTQP
jgi:cell division protein FtsB